MNSLPDPFIFIGQSIPGTQYVIRDHIGTGGRAHVFKARSENLARDVACKIIPSWHLVGTDQNPPAWRTEITNANSVPSFRVVKIFDSGEWTVAGCRCVYLLSDLVNGVTLHKYIQGQKIDIGFVETLMFELLDFLRELDEANLHHGDLHDRNIMIEDRRNALSGPKFTIRIADFGVAPATEAELLDDYEELAKTCHSALSRVDYASLAPEDRSIFNFLSHDFLGKRLLEKDTTFDPDCRKPRALASSLRAIRSDSFAILAGSKRTLSTPFDYLSCEQLGEYHVLLKELYSDKMLGLTAIEDVNNLVLTGPRGCGKTTVYRSLSLRHRVLTDDAALKDVSYIGVYYRCDDLSFSFPRYRLPERQEAWDVPIHFLTSTLLAELFDAISRWIPNHAADWSRLESACTEELWGLLELTAPQAPSGNTFKSLVSSLRAQRDRAAKEQRLVSDPAQTFGLYFRPNVLPNACNVLAHHFSLLVDRPIFFFVDDYSTPKVSVDLQRNLNRLVMQRSASCFFKLATESPASYEISDVDGKSYVEGREFKLVNLGMDFINADGEDKLRFVDDVFNKRFKYAPQFPVKTLEALIGNDSLRLNSNEIARQLREKKKWQVWGREALGELCSGDVHFLIELVGKMVALQGGADALSNSESPAIPPNIQNRAIRSEAGGFLRNLRALPRGQELVAVVEAFGSVAASYLRHKNSKNEDADPPHQASRIEPYEDPRFGSEAKAVYDELLRYSVFIEDVRGKSRRGQVVPRLYLRRFLIPFFNLTFSKRDSLELTVEELSELLLRPRDFESRKRLQAPQDFEGPRTQLDLNFVLDKNKGDGEP